MIVYVRTVIKCIFIFIFVIDVICRKFEYRRACICDYRENTRILRVFGSLKVRKIELSDVFLYTNHVCMFCSACFTVDGARPQEGLAISSRLSNVEFKCIFR